MRIEPFLRSNSVPQLHRGVVTDTQDPHGELRLKVQVPSVLGEKEIWAWPFVGGRGFKAPSSGAGVWVWFEQGDCDRALWLMPSSR
jgi:hypothetical protein